MFDKYTIGKNIERIIKRWGLKQQSFAELIAPEMNRFKVSSYVTEGSKPSVEFMIILRRLTGLEIEQLFLGEVDVEEIPPEPIAEQVFQDLQSQYGINMEEAPESEALADRVDAMEAELRTLKAEVQSLRDRLDGQ
ncbi:MAG: hypothetical protein AAF146_16795 [Bacteroidota bacterium]